ncbi:hypothetical protein ACIOJD_20540 [Streptomyces sp. NPDC088116]|uniref:hypothetical protein n=1 Tax=Streptomyces sp. NPDC088116 TaxID=3365825 RepID=UPI00381048A3
MARRWVLLPALALGGLWWWAVLRIALEPEHTGLVEGAVAAGGWGLSLLPVHAASSRRRQGQQPVRRGQRPERQGQREVRQGLRPGQCRHGPDPESDARGPYDNF